MCWVLKTPGRPGLRLTPHFAQWPMGAMEGAMGRAGQGPLGAHGEWLEQRWDTPMEADLFPPFACLPNAGHASLFCFISSTIMSAPYLGPPCSTQSCLSKHFQHPWEKSS